MAEPNGAVREMLDSASVTAESIGALHGSAVVRVLQPARYGGLALGTEEFVSVVLECAALDGSLGWLASVFNAAAHAVADLPAHVADKVWNSDPHALITTSHRAAEGCRLDEGSPVGGIRPRC